MFPPRGGAPHPALWGKTGHSLGLGECGSILARFKMDNLEETSSLGRDRLLALNSNTRYRLGSKSMLV